MRLLVAALVCALWTGCANDDPEGPEIYQLTPAAAAAGATIDVVGFGFCGELGVGAGGECVVPPAASVRIGAEGVVVRAESARWLDDRITVSLPDDLNVGVTLVTVAVDGVVSNAVDFEVVP